MEQQFREKHIRLFSNFLEDNFGIHYTQIKADMLQVKIKKLMDRNNITSYDEYFAIISGNNPKDYLTQFLDEISTHTTNFFRENSHFDYIKDNLPYLLSINKRINSNSEIRAWSAACSTGQEPYTLAMVLKEKLPINIKIKILATDLSSKVIAAASKGEYPKEIGLEMGKYYVNKYFEKKGDKYQITDELKKLVKFRIFNLMEPFIFKKGFDIIFCRNVMIYFEASVQASLVDKMYDALVPGGLLFIGYSEGLVYKEHKFKYVQPTVYMKA